MLTKLSMNQMVFRAEFYFQISLITDVSRHLLSMHINPEHKEP